MSGRPDADQVVIEAFAVLGVPTTATLAEVRAARRRLAHEVHPDHGGDEAAMRMVNGAFDLAVKVLLQRAPPAPGTAPGPVPPESPRSWVPPDAQAASRAARRSRAVQHDAPSFTIDALPVEAFEALLVVTTWVGEALVDDPPYLLEVFLREPAPCWCRLDLVPEAGASMVSITVAGIEGEEVPLIDDVRDLWIALINELGHLPD